MATVTSGTLKASANGATITATWKITATNYANNNYTVNVTAKTTGSVAQSPVYVVGLSSGSTTYLSKQGSTGFSVNQNITIPSGKTFTMSVRVTTTGGASPSNTAAYTVPTIDRASTITLSNTSVTLGNFITVTLGRKVNTYTHTITGGFSTSSLTDTLATNVGTGTTLSFPVNTFAPRITNATSKSYIIRVTTYSGSTPVGSKDKTITLNVPSDIVPSISSIVAIDDANNLKDLGVFYNRRSILTLEDTDVLGQGSPIVSRTIEFNGISVTTTAYPARFGVINLATIPDTPLNATLTIRDGRGRTATASIPIPVIEYSFTFPEDVDAYRSDANGNRDSEGTYITVTGTYLKTSVLDENDQEQNFVYRGIYVDDNLVYESGNVDDTDATNSPVTLPLTGDGIYNINRTYRVTVRYGDSVSGYIDKPPIIVPTALRPISINANGSAIAFGKPCRNTDVGMLVYYDPIYMLDRLIISTSLDDETKVINACGGTHWVQRSSETFSNVYIWERIS